MIGDPDKQTRRSSEPLLSIIAGRVSEHQHSLGQLRDLVLILVPVLYVIGYATWSINAYHVGLGALPALNEQYLVAGILPTIVFGVAYFVHKVLVHHASRLDENLPEHYRQIHFAARIVLSCFAFAFLTAIAVFPDRVLGSERQEDVTTWEIAIIVVLGLVSLVFPATREGLIAGTASRRDDLSRVRAFKIHLLLLPMLLVCVGLYVSARFVTFIPNALGGLQPRCAELDLALPELSDETLHLFGFDQDDQATPDRNVRRTPLAVRVLFVGREFTALRFDDDSEPIEVRGDAIKLVAWRKCASASIP